MRQLQDRLAVILGVDEIGAGVGARFLREGATVVIADPQPARAEALADQLGEGAHAIDMTPCDRPALEAGLAQARRIGGGVHILVNNLLPPPVVTALDDQRAEAFDAAFAAVRATAFAMQAALPHMRDQLWGRIITIGHRYGETVNEAIGAYNAAAWALVGLTRSAAADWGRHQIAVNLLLPVIDGAELAAARARRPAIIDLFVGHTPLRRAGDAIEDIGGAALFLAGDDVRFVTGQVIHADGGQHVAAPVLNPVRFAG